MRLLSKSRTSELIKEVPAIVQPAIMPAVPRSGSNLERVEIVGEWTLPFHGGRSGPVAAPSTASPASTSTKAPTDQTTPPTPPTVAAAPCPACSNDPASELGGFLFWEQAGPARIIRCVECSPPPMRRLVADLWLVEWDEAARDGAGCERWACASESDRWKRVAFARLAAAEQKQRESNATKVKRDNEGF